MTVNEMAQKLNMNILAGKNGASRGVKGCYSGDLLSWVMGRAREGDVWLTVMGNINAIAVAALADTACIVLTENSSLDNNAKEKADSEEIAVLSTEKNSFETAVLINELLKECSL